MVTSPAPVTLATTQMTTTVSGWSAFLLATASSSHLPPFSWKTVRTAMTTSRFETVAWIPALCCSGSVTRPPLSTTGPNAWVKFHSDGTFSDNGFNITYLAQPMDAGCGGAFTSESGVRQSPNYPNAYNHDAKCVWTVTVNPVDRVTLRFTNLELEGSINCQYDYVEVRAGNTMNSPLMGRYCGNNLPASMTTSGNMLYVEFVSDSTVTSAGFRATWDVLGPGDQQTSHYISNVCYGADAACDFFKLQCAEHSVIRLIDLIVGRKDATQCLYEYHCDNSSKCCEYEYDDRWSFLARENRYNTYRHCSGRSNCSEILKAPRQVIDTITGETSSYMVVDYNCKEVADIIPMCGGPLKKTTKVTKSTDIWFDGSTETFDSYRGTKECKCSFTNLHTHNSTELFLALIDVRLESHNRDVNASSAMCSNAILQSGGFSWRCKESTEHWKDNFIYPKSETDAYRSITLSPGQTTNVLLKDIHKNGSRDSPAMIWFNARSRSEYPHYSDLMLNMTCGEVIPTELAISLTAITQQTTAADTTRADTMASDGNLSTRAIVAISVSSGVALTLLVVVVSYTVFRALRTRKSHTSVELHSPVHHTLYDINTASCHNNKLEEDDIDGTVYHTIDDTHIASSQSNVHESKGYESLSRDGDYDNSAYLGVIPADNTVVRELRDYETPDSHMYLDLEPRNGNTNNEHRNKTVLTWGP